MNKVTIAIKLVELRGKTPIEHLTAYAVRSIEKGVVSYPVANLITYCKDASLRMVLTDKATLESYPLDEMPEVHEVIQMIMRRYKIDDKLIYRKTGVYYTPPKGNEGSLSMNTLLAVCEALHCTLTFVKK